MVSGSGDRVQGYSNVDVSISIPPTTDWPSQAYLTSDLLTSPQHQPITSLAPSTPSLGSLPCTSSSIFFSLLRVSCVSYLTSS